MRPMHAAFIRAALLLAASCTVASASNSTGNLSTGAPGVDPIISTGSKVVKVCTTGDYPPLTNYDPIAKYTGLAPTVLKHFGLAYSYDIEFVRTTWATLEEDLESGSKCLLAAGGISETLNRSARFGVSVPLLSNKKVPIFSKENAAQFKSFTDLDRAGVTVLENKGGSNEAFVESLRAKGMLSHPTVRIVPSNEETWACLAKYTELPLVMFTDTIEAQFRAGMKDSVFSNAGVTFAMPPGMDTVSHKVYLASKSSEGVALLDNLNRFLIGARASGLFEAWRREAFTAEYRLPSADCPLELMFV